MKSEYIENFDGIRASEQSKQKAINTLINYVNGATVSGTSKKQKRFKWSAGRIAAAASTAAVFIFCAIFIPVILNGGYGGSKDKIIKDYYEEYSFELPFKHTVGNNQYTTLYFNTELTMEQMCESINEAGYKANLYNNESIKRIFITAEKGEFSYYFIIYDKSYLEPIHGNNSAYTLRDCSAVIGIHTSGVSEQQIHVFLFPLHSSGTVTDNSNIRKIYCTFDELAEFYRATGKNDAQIDYENMTVMFFCEGNSDRNWIRGNVVMQYIESENGNYVNIQPQPT